jgi:hypothetical protein
MAASARLGKEAMASFRQMQQKRKFRCVVWKINDEEPRDTVIDDVQVPPGGGVAELCAALSDREPRYIAYDHEFKTHDGRTTSKIYFIYWIPHNANQEICVLYTNSLNEVRNDLTGIAHNYTYKTHSELNELLGDGGDDDEESEEEFD